MKAWAIDEDRMANGPDGLVPVGTLDCDDCCPPDPCDVTATELACRFVDLMPGGQMWDHEKGRVRERIAANEPASDGSCTSMVAHAAHVGMLLHEVIALGVRPMLREMHPATAYDTLDDWLDRYGWQHCYETACRDAALGDLTPLERAGACGPTYCPPNYDADLSRAVKRGIVIALHRISHGISRNVAGLNFALSALGASVSHQAPEPCTFSGGVTAPVEYGCHDVNLLVASDGSEELYAPGPEICDCGASFFGVAASAKHVCEGVATTVYPGVLAAHCIVHGLFLGQPNVTVHRAA